MYWRNPHLIRFYLYMLREGHSGIEGQTSADGSILGRILIHTFSILRTVSQVAIYLELQNNRF